MVNMIGLFGVILDHFALLLTFACFSTIGTYFSVYLSIIEPPYWALANVQLIITLLTLWIVYDIYNRDLKREPVVNQTLPLSNETAVHYKNNNNPKLDEV